MLKYFKLLTASLSFHIENFVNIIQFIGVFETSGCNVWVLTLYFNIFSSHRLLKEIRKK